MRKKTTSTQPKQAGLPIRSNIRAGAYFTITFSAGGGNPADAASTASEPADASALMA